MRRRQALQQVGKPGCIRLPARITASAASDWLLRLECHHPRRTRDLDRLDVFAFSSALAQIGRMSVTRLPEQERARLLRLTFFLFSSDAAAAFGSRASHALISNPSSRPGFSVKASRSCCGSKGCRGGQGVGSGFETRWSREGGAEAEAAAERG